jgi:hypothetical protein
MRRRPDPLAGGAPAARGPDRCLVYVEGARDRDILRSWARRLSPTLGRALVEASVILGGRQPARALAHLREQTARAAAPVAGLCLLDRDRDGGGDVMPLCDEEPPLEFFTWGRRHIESYLLVPDAIRRGLRVDDHDGHFARWLHRELPPLDDEARMREVDAKRWLGPKGPLARTLGRPVAPGRIARAMRPDEFHPDVHSLLERLRALLGEAGGAPVVHVRAALGQG